jgi:hypothetical protein
MSDRVLAKQFAEDAGTAFVAVIRQQGRPVGLQEIRSILIDAGVRLEDVNRQWARVRGLLKEHPNISKPKPTSYEWSPVARSSQTSLAELSKKARRTRAPGWLVQAHVDNIADSLARAETTGPRAQIGWTEQREREKAVLVADLVGGSELLVAEGRSASGVVDWLLEEAARRRVRPTERVGEQVLFNRDRHDAVGTNHPRPGQEVRVVRSGFSWYGGGHEVVLAKALVT